MSSHARLGPSNVRWTKCPGSVRAEAGYPDISGAAAIDGTGSHLLLEMCLINGVRADAYDRQRIGVDHDDMPLGWVVAPDRCARVQICLDYVEKRVAELRRQFPEAKIEVFAESKSNPGAAFGRDDWWGTCDITILVTNMGDDEVVFVEVVDYKDGRGYVSEQNNTQLMAYLFGKVYTAPQCPTGQMTIVQPKTKNAIRTQTMGVPELTERMTRLHDAAQATDAEDAPLIAGKHCQWCKHAGNCSAKNDKAKGVITEMETTGLVAQVHDSLVTMQGDELAKILDAEKAFKEAFDKARGEAQRRIETGHVVPGYVMAPGNATRKWNEDEETMVKKLKSMKLVLADIFPPKLIAPSAAEKIEKLTEKQKINLGKLISTIEGKPRLKPLPKTDAADVFADVLEPQLEQSFL